MQIGLNLKLSQPVPGTTALGPRLYFQNGEQGVWYEPSDLSTLFQDAAGTTPVTAVEQPVGLMLDKRLGLVPGSELVTNGDFSGGLTGWTQSNIGTGTSTVSSGQLVLSFNTSSNRGRVTQQITSASSGKWYEIRLQVISGLPNINIGTSSAAGDTFAATVGSTGLYVYRVLAGSQLWVTFLPNAGSTADSVIDNISVRELPGNHAYTPAAASTSRPTVSARYNLLTYTEDFTNAVWTKVSTATITPNTTIAPDGTLTADTINLPAIADEVYYGTAGVAGVPLTFSIYLAGSGTIVIGAYDNVSGVQDAARITLTSTLTRYTFSFTFGAGSTDRRIYPCSRRSSTLNTATSVITWGADLRVSNDGVGLPVYQRVAASTDYDTAGFPIYLRADGSNDYMLTNSIDFTATDKMTVVAGVRKLSDAAVGEFIELSTDSRTLSGAFDVRAPNSAGTYTSFSHGTAAAAANQEASASTYTAPITNVVSATHDISGDLSTINVNGVAGTSGTGDKGSGNFGNYPLYLFGRGGTSLFYNGRCYGLIVRGAQSNATDLAAMTAYINADTKAY